MRPELFTIGHSTHPLDRFLALLAQHSIAAVADVRRFPGSRKHPHFGRDSLAVALPQAGVDYRWIEALGGRRKKGAAASPNRGLRNESFRSYADYMVTPGFLKGVSQLLEMAGQGRTAFMCSEGLYWRCHRRLICDYLVLARGLAVWHIMPGGQLRPHAPTEGASLIDGVLCYPPQAGQARASPGPATADQLLEEG